MSYIVRRMRRGKRALKAVAVGMGSLVDVGGAATRRASGQARRRSAAGDWKAIGGDFHKAIKAVERTGKITPRTLRHEGAN